MTAKRKPGPRRKRRKPAPLISQRAYAAHRRESGLPGGTVRAVQQAIAGGRLRDSLAKNARGHWQIADVAAADAEWARYTDDAKRPHAGPTAPVGDGELDARDTISEARARKAAAAAELAELELAEKRGELVPARDVEARMVRVFAHCKTRLLGVPARARQRDPALTPPQIRLIERLIREALAELAAGR